jgi:hypothetical protein
MTISQSHACARLQALGLNRQTTHRIIQEVSKWVSNSGEEWTVKRLKAYKVEYIHYLSGRTVPTPWCSHRRDGRPSGPLGILFSAISSIRVLTRSLNVLMAYTAYVAPSLTDSQLKMFKDTVEKTALHDRVWFDIYDARSTDLPRPRKTYSSDYDIGRLQVQALLMETRRGTRTSILSRQGRESVPVRNIASWYTTQWYEANALANQLGFQETMFKNLPIPGDPQSLLDHVMTSVGRDDYPLAGSIGFLQEPGFKLRTVANPNRVIQSLLVPLRKELEDVLKQIPEDCTFDQAKGVEKVWNWIREGRKVHSVDLSDATNHFPLHYQMRTLEDVVSNDKEQLLSLFEGVSRSRWYYHTPSDTGTITWTVGQPMGLNPSFAAFSLSHHRLVRQCESWGKDGDYVILGDDIAIVGDNLHQEYVKALHFYDCPISESKTLSSELVAEFAGKVITRYGVIHPFKWNGVSDYNFLDIVKGLGERGLSLLTGPQRQVAKVLAPLPEWEGGLGWNSRGNSISVRYKHCRELIAKLATEDIRPYVDAGVLGREYLYNSQAIVNDYEHLFQVLLMKDSSPRPGESTTLELIREQFQFREDWVKDNEQPGDNYLPGTQDPRPQLNQLKMLQRKLGSLLDKPAEPPLGGSW